MTQKKNGFEEIGPEADSSPEEESSRSFTPPDATFPSSPLAQAVQKTRDQVRQGVKEARDFYNRREVRETVRKGERLFKIGAGIKKENPLTWVHAAFKTAETLYDFDRVSVAPALAMFKAIKETGVELTQDSVTHLFVGLLDQERIKEEETSASSDGKRKGPTLYSYMLTLRDGSPVKVYWFRENFDYSELVCEQGHDVQEVRRALSALLWDHKGRQIEMEWGVNREFAFRTKEEPLWMYEGEFGLTLIQRWLRALEIKMRRFIILDGDPGMGKSTLARHLGMVANGCRVLYVPTDVVMKANSIKYFMDTLLLCAPDIVIMDDIDRMGSKLNDLLALFEETETKIPLLLATTNDLDKLPDALKRPGRFDEIWRIKPPPPHVMGRVIGYLANLEGLTLSKNQVGVIAKVAVESKLSGAHVRELIRRIKLDDLPEDWSAKDLKFDDRDITFSEKWRPRDYKPTGVAVLGGESDSPRELVNDDYDDYDDYDEFDDDYEGEPMEDEG